MNKKKNKKIKIAKPAIPPYEDWPSKFKKLSKDELNGDWRRRVLVTPEFKEWSDQYSWGIFD